MTNGNECHARLIQLQTEGKYAELAAETSKLADQYQENPYFQIADAYAQTLAGAPGEALDRMDRAAEEGWGWHDISVEIGIARERAYQAFEQARTAASALETQLGHAFDNLKPIGKIVPVGSETS